MADSADTFVSVSTAQEIFHRAGWTVSTKCIRGWCENGVLDAVRAGERGYWRIKRSSIDAMIAGDPDPEDA